MDLYNESNDIRRDGSPFPELEAFLCVPEENCSMRKQTGECIAQRALNSCSEKGGRKIEKDLRIINGNDI